MVLNFHQIIVPTTLVHYEIKTKSVAYECTNNFKSMDNNTIVCAPFLSIQWGKKTSSQTLKIHDNYKNQINKLEKHITIKMKAHVHIQCSTTIEDSIGKIYNFS
jgi:hypothetical protein